MADDPNFVLGTLVINLNGQDLELEGKLGKKHLVAVGQDAIAAAKRIPPMNVAYSQPIGPAISLGTLSELPTRITELGAQVGLDSSDVNAAQIKDAFDSLPDIVTTTQLKITDLAIDTTTGRKFQFGFALLFPPGVTGSKIGPIQLKAVGVRITKGANTDPNFVEGTLVVNLRGQDLELKGKIGKKTLAVKGQEAIAAAKKIPPIHVAYSRPIGTAISLGTLSDIPNILIELGSQIGLDASDVGAAEISGAFESLPEIVTTTELRITDLVIDTRSDRKFLFGFALVFPAGVTGSKIGPVQLKAVGVRINKGVTELPPAV